jgi:hypothetical protein
VKVTDRLLYRVDFSGVGLYRATFTTESRCHAVSFNLTANGPELLADVAASVDKLSLADKRNSGPPPPYCIANYAVPENLLQRVEPAAVGPRFMSIPVRIIVDTEGEAHPRDARPTSSAKALRTRCASGDSNSTG